MFYLPGRIHRNARLLVKNIILHYLSVNRRKFLKVIQMLYCIRYVQVETHSGIFPNISWKVYIKYRLFLCNSDKGICSFHQFPTYGFYVFNKYMTSCGQTKRRSLAGKSVRTFPPSCGGKFQNLFHKFRNFVIPTRKKTLTVFFHTIFPSETSGQSGFSTV